MIQTYTRLTVADNSGAKVIRLINIPGSGKRKFAHVGDVVVCNVREAAPQYAKAKSSGRWLSVRPRDAAGPTGRTSSSTTMPPFSFWRTGYPEARGYSAQWPASFGMRALCESYLWLQRWYNAHPQRR